MLNAVVIGLCMLTVVGGTEPNDPPTELKAVVSIKRNNAPVCLGGVVAISTRDASNSTVTYRIITAAHCVYGKQNSGLTVQLQTENISVQKVIVHPYYSPPSRDYDIAIITAENPKTASDLDYFPLSETPPTGKVLAFSWSTTGAKTEEGNVEERKSCKAKLSNNITVSAKMLCVNIRNVHDGTPLIVEASKQGEQALKKVVGIGSYYVKDNGALPKVFTNIANSEIFPFIEQHIR